MTPVVSERALHDELVERLQNTTRKTAIVAPRGVGKTKLINRLIDRSPDLVAVEVPRTVDRVERTILELGASFNDDALRDAIAGQLHRNFDDPKPALELVGNALDGRRLIVDDFDALQPTADLSELSKLFAPSRTSLQTWLKEHATIITSSIRPFGQWNLEEITLAPTDEQPWDISTSSHHARSLWVAANCDKDLYRAALAQWHLLGQPPTADALSDKDSLINTIWEAVPEPVQRVMAVLANYGGAFPIRQFEDFVSSLDGGDFALEYAQQALLIERSTKWYWLGPLWRTRVPNLLEQHVKRQTHLDLAEFFADLTRDDANTDPRWFQAAHRHYLSAGQLRQAAEYMRFGVGLLLEAGRGASRARDYGLAADYYDTVIQLDEKIRADASTGIGDESRGYARHYYHYNRYKNKQETIERTEAGYQRSLEEYPTNALFWSRLIVARFQRDHWEAALATSKRASKAVQDPRARERHLLGRTVTKLVERDLNNAAIVVWGHSTDVVDARACEARHRLSRRGRDGWTTKQLRTPGLRETVFEREVGLEFLDSPAGFRCTIKDARVTGEGDSMLAALRTALTNLRNETADCLQAHTDELSPHMRMRKRELLGLVDIIESEIKGPGPQFRWLTGKISLDAKGRSVFVPGGALDGEYHEIEPSVSVPRSVTGIVEAKLRTGRGGAPTGPVVALEPLFKTQEERESARDHLETLLGNSGS